MRRFQSNAVRRLTVALAAVCSAHFVLSLAAWGLVLWWALHCEEVIWAEFCHAIPAAALLIVFLASATLAWRGSRVSAAMLFLGVLLSATCFWWDMTWDHWQIQYMTRNEGCKHVYATWWWWHYDR
jgi:hypothetical protein